MMDVSSGNVGDPITIVDAGARYGVFTLWKEYFNTGNIRYLAFEPDPEEAQRLAAKYAQDTGRYSVYPNALYSRTGDLALNLMKHRGGNSLLKPTTNSAQLGTHLSDASTIEKSIQVPCVDLDSFSATHDLSVDFMKVDTEGSDLSVLEGANDQLARHVVGIYVPVYFNPMYEDATLIDEVMRFLSARNFYCVNLDYSGKGAARNRFVTPDRYGVIVGCYSLWLKKLPLLEADTKVSLTISESGFALKQALVSLLHYAPDVGLEILLRLSSQASTLEPWRQTPLLRYIDLLVQRLFRDLRSNPAYDEDDLADVYRGIFGRDLKRGHTYFQSDEINPR